MSNTQTSVSKGQTSVSADEKKISPKPDWLKVKFPAHRNFFHVADILRNGGLHTICQSAKCPNIAECWSARTATFLVLGDVCTRRCGFCAVPKGKTQEPSADEPGRIAETVEKLGLDYAVITSVTRDDLPDGGASVFVQTIQAIKAENPRVKVEVLIPDFQGNKDALTAVVAAGPDVVNHNLETTEARYPFINRPRENYRRSLGVLEKAKEMGAVTKSGLMVGLGENESEIGDSLADLRRVGCDLLTIGQYLRPSRENVPVQKYYTPGEFEDLKTRALDSGFKNVVSGPLVRSSYQAHRLYQSLEKGAFKEPCAT